MRVEYISILIVLISFFFIKSKKQYFKFYTFFIPFNSTALLMSSGSSLSLPLALFFIFFLRWTVDLILGNWKLSWIDRIKQINKWLILFALTAIISEIMPFVLNIKVLDIYSRLLTYAVPIQLIPKLQYITQLAYLLLGLFTTYLIANYFSNYKYLQNVIRIFLISNIFIALWGWFELICGFTELPYPYFLFDHIGLSKYGINYINGMPRISSVTLEPSVFSQIVSWTLPVIYFYRFRRKKTLSYKLFDIVLLSFFILTLIFSQSSTGLIAIAVFLIFVFFDLLKNLTGRNKLIFVGFAAALVILISPFFVVKLFDKMDSYSGFERAKSFIYGFEYFTSSPFLGVGWGVFPVWDVLLCIAAGAGLIGLVFFLKFIFSVRDLYRKALKTNLENDENLLAEGLWKGLLIVLILGQLSGFIYYEQYIWFILGITIATLKSMLHKKEINESPFLSNHTHN